MDQVVASARNATQAGKQFASSSTGQLARIEGLVTVSCLLVGVLVLCNSRRRHDGRALHRLLVWGAFLFNYPVISYTIGLMQSSSIHNELFVVWACFLLLLVGSADTMTAFNLDDKSQQTRLMLNQAIHIVYLLFLILYYKGQLRGTFRISLFLLWSLSVVRIGLRLKAYLSTNRSRGLMRDKQVVFHYTDTQPRNWEVDRHGRRNYDPTTMQEYVYLIDGKEVEKVQYGQHVIHVDNDAPETVEVNKVWQCEGKLLRSTTGGDGQGGAARRRDLCLSFALFRKLLLRFAPDHVGPFLFPMQDDKSWDFVVKGLLADDNDLDRAYRVVETELGFLFDFFYARYPSIKDSLAPDLVVYAAILATSLFTLFSPDLLRYHRRPLPGPGDGNDASDIIIHGFNLDLLVTRLVIVWYIFLESYQFLAFIFSDWHKVKMLCRYVRNKSWHRTVMEVPLKVLCHFTVTRYWKGTIEQFFLLDNIRPHWIKTFFSRFSLKAEALDACLMTHSIPLPSEVSHAVLRELKKCEGGKITDGRMWLYRMDIIDLNLDRVLSGNTHAPYILKWHIATSICDYGLSMEDTAIRNDIELQKNREIAMKLSGYCAYLLALQPEVVQESTYRSISIVHGTLQNARDFLGLCKSPEAMYNELIKLGRLKISKEQEMEQKTREIMSSSDSTENKYKKIDELESEIRTGPVIDFSYLSAGAHVAVYLIDRIVDARDRWRVLAAFWANLMLYIAPSDRAAAHASRMATGGEFITLIWALLTAAHIVEPLPFVDGGGNTGLHIMLEKEKEKEKEKEEKYKEDKERRRSDKKKRHKHKQGEAHGEKEEAQAQAGPALV
ncbi:hypothetical protein HU200_021879 [Digitaria exilis]|uniref:DUF4220 domain-containing protein n=1 Tax=Digitaria exilis TaxID=1010633 RepID=A0A835EZ05_9POAL|nr:hypothetical protein HU200_021879 [Digitaria exilis]